MLTDSRWPRRIVVSESENQPEVAALAYEETPTETTEQTRIQQSDADAISEYERIAHLVYSYWEERGYQHGFAPEDWLRAEQEYLLPTQQPEGVAC